MPTEWPKDRRLDEASKLATKLAERSLAEMMLHGSLPAPTVRVLANAALLLEEHAYPIPPLVLDLLTRLDEQTHDAESFSG